MIVMVNLNHHNTSMRIVTQHIWKYQDSSQTLSSGNPLERGWIFGDVFADDVKLLQRQTYGVLVLRLAWHVTRPELE